MTVDDDEQESREEAVLVEWYLAAERGESPELIELCDGDGALADRVRALLGHEPAALRPRASGSDADDDPRVGATIGGFHVVRRLGRGGMGSVYLAVQRAPRRRVALKVLDRASLSDERERRRFAREADLVASLDHPNIVPIHSAGEEDGEVFLAMKALAGPSLDEFVKPLPPREVARIGRAIADALDVAHRHGIVHRDVKPSNVLMDGETPVLVDFGLARSATDATLTREGHVAGTLAYLAPERLADAGGALDPRSDVYGLAATLYEMLTGKPPFDEASTEALLARIAWDAPRPLRLARGDRDLATIIEAGLEKDVRLRLPTAARFADELGRFLDGRPTTIKPVGLGGRLARWSRRHPGLAAATLVTVLFGSVLSALTIASRLDAAAARERTVDVAVERIADERFHEALALLSDLGSPSPEERELIDAGEAGAALGDLLDRLVDVRATRTAERWRELLADVEATSAPRRHPALTDMARALVAWHVGDDEAARTHATSASAAMPRAASAFGLLLGDDEEPVPPADEGEGVDERVLVAATSLLAGRPIESAIEELEGALAVDASDRRARLGLALAFVEVGRRDDALLVLRGLVTERPDARVYREQYIRALELSRRYEAARRELERVPRDDWSVREFIRDAALVLGEQGVDAAIDTAREAVDQLDAPQDRALMELYLANFLDGAGSLDEARDVLDGIDLSSAPRVFSETVAALRYRLAVDAASLDGSSTDVFVELAGEGERLLDSMRFPPARAVVTWKYAAAVGELGRFKEYVTWMERAVPFLDDTPWARHELAKYLLGYAGYQRQRGADDEVVRYFEQQAWEHGRIAFALTSDDDPIETRLEIFVVAVVAARSVDAWDAVRSYLDEPIAERLPADARDELERRAEEFDAALEEAYAR